MGFTYCNTTATAPSLLYTDPWALYGVGLYRVNLRKHAASLHRKMGIKKGSFWSLGQVIALAGSQWIELDGMCHKEMSPAFQKDHTHLAIHFLEECIERKLALGVAGLYLNQLLPCAACIVVEE